MLKKHFGVIFVLASSLVILVVYSAMLKPISKGNHEVRNSHYAQLAEAASNNW